MIPFSCKTRLRIKALLFVNKKQQKNFILLALGRLPLAVQRARTELIKVFWFFFALAAP
jgi:hypothetical protein